MHDVGQGGSSAWRGCRVWCLRNKVPYVRIWTSYCRSTSFYKVSHFLCCYGFHGVILPEARSLKHHGSSHGRRKDMQCERDYGGTKLRISVLTLHAQEKGFSFRQTIRRQLKCVLVLASRFQRRVIKGRQKGHCAKSECYLHFPHPIAPRKMAGLT